MLPRAKHFAAYMPSLVFTHKQAHIWYLPPTYQDVCMVLISQLGLSIIKLELVLEALYLKFNHMVHHTIHAGQRPLSL